MRLSAILFQIFRFLLTPAVIALIYLYLYPAVNGCNFPPARRALAACLIDGSQGAAQELAPFRLLALGDPQLEGDTSLPDPDAAYFPSWKGVEFSRLHLLLADVITRDIPELFQSYRKALDLLGNDYYLAHIYRTVRWWTGPTHVVVLGDLLGSQWIDDEEFAERTRRFWDRVFSDADKVPDSVSGVRGRTEVLGAGEDWNKWVIAVAGNHDIGYAGDIDDYHMERFEPTFGPVNWDVHFELRDALATKDSNERLATMTRSLPFAKRHPRLHVVVLNSMNLDAPAYNNRLRDHSLDFLAQSLTDPVDPPRHADATVLLTHIPLHKEANICVDAPFIDYFPASEGGGIKEQNHLSEETSRKILDGLAGSGRNGTAIVINGHDHEGCDTYHYRPMNLPRGSEGDSNKGPWKAVHYYHPQTRRLRLNDSFSGLREITVRSMMGSFGGNAGLLSAWFDAESEKWEFEYGVCVLGVQHMWWAIHVLTVVELGTGLAGVVSWVLEQRRITPHGSDWNAKFAGKND